MTERDNQFSFYYEDTNLELKNVQDLKKWLSWIFENEKKDADLIEYVFCSDEYLLNINKEYLNHDFYTDIITFPLSENPISATIYLSVDRIKENSIAYSQSFDREIARVMAHGVLHLIGYDDKSDDEVKIMRQKEDEYLAKMNGI